MVLRYQQKVIDGGKGRMDKGAAAGPGTMDGGAWCCTMALSGEGGRRWAMMGGLRSRSICHNTDSECSGMLGS